MLDKQGKKVIFRTLCHEKCQMSVLQNSVHHSATFLYGNFSFTSLSKNDFTQKIKKIPKNK